MPPQEDALVARASTTIAAGPDAVWTALVEPAAIKQYMFGTTVESDWDEGSSIVWKGEWKGRAYEDKGVILRFEPGRLLAYSHFSPLSGLPDEPQNYHRVTMELAPERDGTRVSLTQDGSRTAEARDHSEEQLEDDARLPQAIRRGPRGGRHMRLTATTFVTLDGVMQAPGGPEEDRSGGFEHGGWSFPYADEDFGKLVTGWFAQAEAFLLGRRTYEIFAAFWPQVTEDVDLVASRLNTLPKYVASRTLKSVSWQGATLLQGDVAEEVARLKGQPGRELQVHGSGDLLQTLMAHDLVDEYRLFVYPVVLGSGRRLFRDGAAPRSFKLVDATTTSTGVVVATYARGGAVVTGSFTVDQP